MGVSIVDKETLTKNMQNKKRCCKYEDCVISPKSSLNNNKHNVEYKPTASYPTRECIIYFKERTIVYLYPQIKANGMILPGTNSVFAKYTPPRHINRLKGTQSHVFIPYVTRWSTQHNWPSTMSLVLWGSLEAPFNEKPKDYYRGGAKCATVKVRVTGGW